MRVEGTVSCHIPQPLLLVVPVPMVHVDPKVQVVPFTVVEPVPGRFALANVPVTSAPAKLTALLVTVCVLPAKCASPTPGELAATHVAQAIVPVAVMVPPVIGDVVATLVTPEVIAVAVCAVTSPFALVVTAQTWVASPHAPEPLFTVANVAATDPVPDAVTSPVRAEIPPVGVLHDPSNFRYPLEHVVQRPTTSAKPASPTVLDPVQETGVPVVPVPVMPLPPPPPEPPATVEMFNVSVVTAELTEFPVKRTVRVPLIGTDVAVVA